MKPSEVIKEEARHLLEDVLPPGASIDPATRAEALSRATIGYLDQEAGHRESIYRDTESRYLNDAAFHAAVKMLEAAAERHGFTPGELKQVAFKAALNLEMRRVPRGLDAGAVAGHLKDGTPVFYGRQP